VSHLHKAYVGLAIAAANEDGLRTVSIRRFSALEVRLVEFATRQQADNVEIWIELYDYEPNPRWTVVYATISTKRNRC
jgi:hypothetical protein